MAKTSGGVRGGDTYRKGDEWFEGYVNLHKRQNARGVFNNIDAELVPTGGYAKGNYRTYDYTTRGYSGNILNAVSKYGSGSAKDIADKFVSGNSRYPMSDKQKWSVAFAFFETQTRASMI